MLKISKTIVFYIFRQTLIFSNSTVRYFFGVERRREKFSSFLSCREWRPFVTFPRGCKIEISGFREGIRANSMGRETRVAVHLE